MGRTKIKHELISDGSTRRATFKKRRVGVLKKLSELTTLCGVPACAVIYNPSELQLDVWPSPQEAFHVLSCFKNLPPKRREKYMMDQREFLSKQIAKLNEQLEKEREKNRRLENDIFMAEHLVGKDISDLNCLGTLARLDQILDEKIERVNKRIEFIAGITAENDKKTAVERGEV